MSGSQSNHDYIVVGAGSAGCALAHRLSEDGDADVLLLEAGAPDDREEIHVPPMFIELFETDVDWEYYTTPQSGMNGRELYWPRGKTLGGSSSMNGNVYIRGHPDDYDRWAELGNEGWGYDEMLEYFKRAEHFEPGADEFHGEGGPLNVTENAELHEVSEAIVEAMTEVGMERNDDFNGAEQEGAGFYHVTTKDGRRCSSAAAYIKPALDWPNLDVETNAHVTEVRFEGDRAVGVTYEKDGKERTADADAEVVVCGGAINSPQLLMLSGIGPAAHLAEHGIDVRVDLPGVGQNLQDHLKVLVVYERTGGPAEPAPSSNVVESGGFVHTDPDSPQPDLQFHNAPVFILKHGLTGPDDASKKYFSLGPTQIRPESSGEVRLASADPFDAPVIDPNYLAADGEIDLLVHGVRLAREIAEADALADYRGEEVWPGEDVTSDEEIREYVRDHATTVYHPAGTCRMGDDDMAVVDDSLRVHGVSGLRVVDTSIMPDVVAGNTNAPAIAIAEKAADLIRQERAVTADD